MPEPVTGDAEIRPGAKFTEDALAQTCEALREENRKKQTALDLQDSELRELRAQRAALIQQLNDRRIPWVAAMAAELIAKARIDDAGHYMQDAKGLFILNRKNEAVELARNVYAETERQLAK